MRPAPSEDPALRKLAHAFVDARLAARALDAYPGSIPRDLDAAYACQDLAIDLWPDAVAGWKVGWIAPNWQARFGEERLVGPIFTHNVWQVADAHTWTEVPVFAGGFGAIEAEYVFRVAADAPPDRHHWTVADAARMVSVLHVAVEIASSPLATINELGPAVVISDFGNNGGLLLGPEIADWTPARDRDYTCSTEIDGMVVGRGGSGTLPGGPLAALAFALGRAASRGRALRAGQLVTTGAATGIHDILPGQSSRIVFDQLTEIRCRAVARRANGGA